MAPQTVSSIFVIRVRHSVQPAAVLQLVSSLARTVTSALPRPLALRWRAGVYRFHKDRHVIRNGDVSCRLSLATNRNEGQLRYWYESGADIPKKWYGASLAHSIIAFGLRHDLP